MPRGYIRYTPIRLDEYQGEWRSGERDSAIAAATLVIAVEPFKYGRFGTQEGALIVFLDGKQRYVAETCEEILKRIEAERAASAQES
jgi:hypothetical protein